MAKYRKKPVVIEAIQYKVVKEIACKYGVHKETNSMEIAVFMGKRIQHVYFDEKGEYIKIPTLEGTMQARVGDYIIKGVKGEFYPCKPDIFEMTYEKVDAECIDNSPTIDAVPVVCGEWKLYGNDDDSGMSYWCTACNFQLSEDLFYSGYENDRWIESGVFKYCPNCGAKMEVEP